MTPFDSVLITGGAKGIGRELALAFVGEGAEVTLTDVDAAALDETVRELEARGGRARGHVMDVTDGAAIERVRTQLRDDGVAINVLVNNAGVVFGGSFTATDIDDHLATFRVNTEGIVRVTHAFLPDLIARREAFLVNVASASGLTGLPYGSTYAASKWAAIGFSESIRMEMKAEGHDVAVTTVCPGYVNTGMFAGAAPPRTTQMLEPAELAALIIERVRAKKPFLLEPWIIKVTPALKGLLPVVASDFLSDLLGATSSMQGWRGHGGGGPEASTPRSSLPRVDALLDRLRGLGLPL